MTYYDDQTFDAIKERMMARAPADVDKRENSSILYNALAPAAAELAIEYTEMESLRKDMSIYTASDDAVDMHCAMRGITRRPATAAIMRGQFNRMLPAAARFSLNEWNYISTEYLGIGEDGYHYYKMQCETPGSASSFVFGHLIPIITIPGLTVSELVGNIQPGEDPQTTKELVEEYIASFDSLYFGGNVAAYRHELEKMDGVGGGLVWTATVTSMPGHVRVVFVTSAFTAPSAELVDAVQTAIDPDNGHGTGLGLAPPGAVVDVVAATNTDISVTATITVKPSTTWETEKPYVAAAIREYMRSVNKTFASTSRQNALNSRTLSGLVIRVSAIISAITDVDGILDATDVLINGSAENLILDLDNIANLISINGEAV